MDCTSEEKAQFLRKIKKNVSKTRQIYFMVKVFISDLQNFSSSISDDLCNWIIIHQNCFRFEYKHYPSSNWMKPGLQQSKVHWYIHHRKPINRSLLKHFPFQTQKYGQAWWNRADIHFLHDISSKYFTSGLDSRTQFNLTYFQFATTRFFFFSHCWIHNPKLCTNQDLK
jgi:hypothetical protein